MDGGYFVNYDLQQLKGKIAGIEYEFVCEHVAQTTQNESTFFLIELPQILENEIKKDVKNYQPKSMIACFLYGEIDGAAKEIKQYLTNAIANNIYFQTGKCLDGFRNIINASYDYVQCIINDQHYLHKRTVVNLLMKAGSDIYLSTQVYTEHNNPYYEPFTNNWQVCYKNKKKYVKIDKNKDLLDICLEFKQLKPAITSQVQDVILTYDDQFNYDKFLNSQPHYPIQKWVYTTVDALCFLKIKNIN